MTPEEFIAIWKDNRLTERGGAQAHFDDLCDLLGVDKPRDPDNYCFERGARKSAGGDGWADVWKRGCFGWENKKPGRDLDTALKQLTDYSLQLENPPLLVVSDRERIIIHTAFTGYPDQPREIRIEELSDPGVRQLLKWVFNVPEKLRPEKSTAAITAEAAGQFANLAKSMRKQGLDGQRVAHFLVQCLFCMFAEDENLLPANIFTDILKDAGNDVDKAANRIAKLFAAMQKKSGGEYGNHDIPWFNGGLFKTIDVPALTSADLTALYSAAADMDWRAIDPTIFGTLFERGLDPTARAPLGAHYTDTGTIAKLIYPLITEPLLAEWQVVKTIIAAGRGKGPRSKEYKEAHAAYQGFMQRLNRFRVLDPACGSGNFLYLALKALRDVEKLVQIEAQELGIGAELLTYTGPHNILGIEINEYAAELARVTVWIGDIQWCRRNGREIARNPILRPLDSIEHRDALLNADGSEAEWPKADVIVGNPPFLGDKMMRGELGDSYVEKLRKRFDGRVPGGADLVTYWFEKARAQIEAGQASAAGLVTTNSIRQKRNRVVLERIQESTRIFEAWSDEEWINEGAAVRVSLVCFGNDSPLLPGEGLGVRAKITSPYHDIPENILQAARLLRSKQTDAENLLWHLVRNSAMGGFKFRRQHPVAPYILDFYCHEAKLAIELDGGQHAERRDYDENRDKALEELGIKTLRFWNNQLFQETDAVLGVIWDELHTRTGKTPSPRPSPGGRGCVLDGKPVTAIHADLTGSAQGVQTLDLTKAKPLPANKGRSFFGVCLAGSFKVDTATALQWLRESGNPNGRPNSDVVRPIYNGSDITRRWAGNWVVDFAAMEQAVAADYLEPFAYVEAEVKPIRITNNRAARAEKWWHHGEKRPAMRTALNGLTHYIATPETAKHRFFVKFPVAVAPEHKLIVIPRQDDVTFGILSSRIHCLWAIENGGRLGVGNDPVYNSSLCFETFPFPEGLDLTHHALTPGPSPGGRGENASEPCAPLPPGEGGAERRVRAHSQTIAKAAADLSDWREKWLNPEGWLNWEITPEEQAAGFPSRPVPKPEHTAAWKKRTLTNLYNEMPAGLKLRQEALDKAVAATYGWSDYTPEMADDVILGRLLALNLERMK